MILETRVIKNLYFSNMLQPNQIVYRIFNLCFFIINVVLDFYKDNTEDSEDEI